MKHTKKIKKIDKTKQKHVFAAGTFDVLHPGHTYFLSFAKKKGTHLSVCVARDATVKKVKGHLPAMDEETRRTLIESLKPVDNAILGGKKNIFDIVVKLKPDIIVLGHDQKISEKKLFDNLSERGIFAEIIRAPAYKKTKYKSSILKEKVKATAESIKRKQEMTIKKDREKKRPTK